jgi:hypothetical protein
MPQKGIHMNAKIPTAIAALLFVASFAIGLGPVPFILASGHSCKHPVYLSTITESIIKHWKELCHHKGCDPVGAKIPTAIAALLFVASFAIGLGPVPFILASELVGPEAIRHNFRPMRSGSGEHASVIPRLTADIIIVSSAAVVVVGVMVAQQLTGMNSIVMYSVSLLQSILPTTAALI